MSTTPRAVVHCHLPYNGRGWAETCAQTVNRFPAAGLATTLVLPRAIRPLGPGVAVAPAFPLPASRLPWRFLEPWAEGRLDRRFRAVLAAADPATTVVYAWPGIPAAHVEAAQELGLAVVRQMINCTMGTARRILDAAYARSGLEPAHGITAEHAEIEAEELRCCDVVLAPNPEVESSLLEVGVRPERIVASSFGWSPERFRHSLTPTRRRRGLTFLFVGLAGVRKGVPDLLDAWELAGRPGRLVVVGVPEPAVAPRLEEAVHGGTVEHVSRVDDVGASYLDADVFVMPTLEEGGPQVTLEAGGLGVPAITTPMGAARLVEHERNGLLVRPGDPASLAAALHRMAEDPGLRHSLGRQIARDAQAFTYDAVGRRHAEILTSVLTHRAV